MKALPPPVMLSTRIPFAGTYESIWSHAIDWEVEQRAENWQQDRDAFDREFPNLAHIPDKLIDYDSAFADTWEAVDYGAAYRKIAEEYAFEFGAWLSESLGVTELAFEFEEMTSPAFYNFETDRIFVKLSLSTFEEVRRRLAEEAPNALAEAYRELFTSRDGFASFYDNEVPTKPLAEWDHNELFALLVAWTEHQLDGRSLDDELYDYRIGGLYEEVYRIADDATDWPKLQETVERAVLESLDDEARAELALHPRPCPDTLQLPL
jgi:hypothetical protein